MRRCVIFHTALDMTAVLRQLLSEGWEMTPAAIAALSPYIRERIKRFGEYATEGLTDPPAAFNPRLELTALAAGRTPSPRRPPAYEESPERSSTAA